MMTRRQAIKRGAVVAVATAALPRAIAQDAITPKVEQPLIATAATGPFVLPPLPYDFNALEPHIDARTMEIHHDRHHKTYVENLNKAVAQIGEAGTADIDRLLKNLDAIANEKIRTAVRNNGGGHYNHSLFWQAMEKGGSSDPTGELDHAMNGDFGSFNSFKQAFTEAGTKLFGSGWVWLVLDGRQLKIESSSNQDTPLRPGKAPLLGLDVWEHAYYLKYQNKRADYIAAWWNVVNWDFVTERFLKLRS